MLSAATSGAERSSVVTTTMQDANPTIAASSPRPQRPGAAFLLYGMVHEISGQADRLDADFLDKLIQRRLKRLERVLSAHGGRLIKPLPQGLVAGFPSAETALITACEMQRRCAVIPQLSDTQLALKIGIHTSLKQALTQRAVDPAEATAAKLSALLGESGIILSEPVLEDLPAELKEKSTAITNDGSAIAAFSVDWNAVPMRALRHAHAAENHSADGDAPLRGNCLVLREGQRSFVLNGRQHVIAIGRDSASEVPIDSAKVSRQHARIIYRQGNFVLIDMSTNGTYVYPDNAPATRVQKNMLILTGKGRISFGQIWKPGTPHSFEFELYAKE